ncbi:hypothetical protein E0493_21625 [Roseomonas sp. M0104]|uniref:Polymerase nucleotidyl transferase domain-containing protein n=1 Tax=Teichococcus coralli TaxID=2545983 RepID=A0A845BFT8_9PROT|nr:nucleotidyltransferase domain-containing protein [Pseudoroseomonas coralli]MXP65951.1 hypothetical protein [Pseudoroseomonas coralli]
MERAAFLSVRLPPEIRNRIKAAAAARGLSVQDLVGSLVERFLAELDCRSPTLPEMLARLRAQELILRQRGIESLWIVGSAPRGEARPGSSIDLIVEFAPGAPNSLAGLTSLRAALSETVGGSVNLAEWGVLREPARDQVEREAVRVF